MKGAGCRVQGEGCRVQGAGFRVQGSGCPASVYCLKFGSLGVAEGDSKLVSQRVSRSGRAKRQRRPEVWYLGRLRN